MLARFSDFISHHELFDPQDRILVAVSGGIDSMVLLTLFLEAKYDVGIAHCNFQLRGTESDQDERFVRSFCAEADLPYFVQGFDTKNYAGEKGLSVQMAARELRYAWFSEVMEREKYHWLATAHHLNDNLETVLLRWTHGAGLDQLTGIPLKNGKIVRPLLFATRTEIEAYATAEHVKWREDSSNASEDYQRNFVRHNVIAKLKEINPSLEETFVNSLEKLSGAHELMQRGLEQLKDSITHAEGNRFLIDKNLLMLLQHPKFVCYEWLRPFGFEWDRCAQLVDAMGGQVGKQFLSPTHQAVIDREFIIVSPLQESLNEILIEEGQDKAMLGPWMLTIKSSKGSPVSYKANQGSFDRSKIKFPVLWRKWRSGDVFFPLGLGHRKKISDFLIDGKVSLTEKNLLTVLESGGEVIWVVGHRVDDRFKVTSKTTAVLEVTIDHL